MEDSGLGSAVCLAGGGLDCGCCGLQKGREHHGEQMENP